MNCNNKYPTRQVHLDFHTSPDIHGIASNFSKDNFQAALNKGNVESITIFAKCHHSMCYYPTKIGTMHPHLDFDLTGAMLEAAHEIGVRAPIYITAGWSDADAANHPEWRAITKDEKYLTTNTFDQTAIHNHPKANCSWQMLCLNDGEYAEHIYALTEEICTRYNEIDGLFYDICFLGYACYCETCKKGMQQMGLDPDVESDAQKYFILKRKLFMKKCTDILKKYHPDATIFFNSGGADLNKPQYHEFQTHFEMENLPTAWGGYNKLPLRAKFFDNREKGFIGMTGKFHLDWGEFGGFKSKEALKFEIATMATYGAGASIGDHLHPDGEMDVETYKNIGYAYEYLEKIAPFCFGGESTADIGIYLSDNHNTNEGISNILLENQLDFDVISNDNFDKFDTVIISESVVLDDKGLIALKSYIKNGGKLILMADALVKDGKFQIDFGVEYLGKPEYDCDYIISTQNSLGIDVPETPILCNIPAHRTAVSNAQTLAQFITPYFSRTYAHFCGHKNTPYNKTSQHFPAIVQQDNIVYLAHSLPRQYFCYGSLFHKRYFMYALNLVNCKSKIHVEGLGSQGRCTMIWQPEMSRYCINMIYASPIKRGMAEIIEDIVPIYNIKLTLETEKTVKRVYLPLEDQDLKFNTVNGYVNFTVPELNCHTSVVIECYE